MRANDHQEELASGGKAAGVCVLKCGSPLPLFARSSARGLAQSKTWRN